MITIGELDYAIVNDIQKQPGVKLVEHYRWTGTRHTELYPHMIDILKKVWGCKKVVVDATGRRSAGGFIFTDRSSVHALFHLLSPLTRNLN